MLRFKRNGALGAVAGCLLMAAVGTAQAAGALGRRLLRRLRLRLRLSQPADARAAAIKQCAGSSCKIVGSIRRGCAAFAIDAKRPCGSFGWAD